MSIPGNTAVVAVGNTTPAAIACDRTAAPDGAALTVANGAASALIDRCC